jgi:tape measure domain-containing protein
MMCLFCEHALEGKDARDIFSAVAEASARMGSTSQETAGSLLAIAQMMSKGKVTAEELRGQLAERMPQAMNVMARAVGVTAAQLDKLIQGSGLGLDAIRKFAHQLEQESGAGGPIDSLNAQLARLKTAWTDFTVALGNTGVISLVAETLKGLEVSVRSLADALGTALPKIMQIIPGTAAHAQLEQAKELREIYSDATETVRRFERERWDVTRPAEYAQVEDQANKATKAAIEFQRDTGIDVLGKSLEITVAYTQAHRAAAPAIVAHDKAAERLAEHQQTVIDKLKEQLLLLDLDAEGAARLEASHLKLTSAQQAEYVQLKLLVEQKKQALQWDAELLDIQSRKYVQEAQAIDQIVRETAQLTMSNDAIEKQNKLLDAGIDPANKNYDAVSKMIDAEQKLRHQTDLLRDIAGGMKDAFETAFESIFTKGVSGFKDLVTKLEGWFVKLVADLALYAARNPIQMVLTTIAGAIGINNPAAAASSVVQNMTPHGGVLSQPGTGGGIPASVPGGIGWNGGWGWGTALGVAGAGLGGWGLGGMAAGWTGGNQLGGNIGGTLGGIGGYFGGSALGAAAGITGLAGGAVAGSVVPVVGTIVGAILGGLLGSLFGGGGDVNHFNVSLGTNKRFPLANRPTIQGYEDYTSTQGPFGDIGYILRGNNNAFDAANDSSKKFLEGIQQIDTAFAQFLSPAEVAKVKDRLAGMNEVEFKDSFSAVDALKQRFTEMLSAVDPRLASVYKSFNLTADNAGSFAVALVDLRKEFNDLVTAANATTDPVQQVIQSMAALEQTQTDAAAAFTASLTAGDPTKALAAEQALKQAVTNRYQYELNVASQLEQTIETLQDSVAKLQAQAAQLAQSMFKDFEDINQRLASTGGGNVWQLDIYRQARDSLLAQYSATTDPQARLDLLKQGMALVDQALQERMNEIQAWVQQQEALRQQQINALNVEKTAIQNAAQLRIDALNAEKTAIQKTVQERVAQLNTELQAVQALANMLPSIQSAIEQMKYGGQNPLSAFARLGEAQGALADTTDPQKRLQLLQTVLSLGGEAFQRPSPEYQEIYNKVAYEMSQMQDAAQDAAKKAAGLQQQIADVNTAQN